MPNPFTLTSRPATEMPLAAYGPSPIPGPAPGGIAGHPLGGWRMARDDESAGSYAG